MTRALCLLGRATYRAGGMQIVIRGRQANRQEAPILVIAPHSTFLDGGIVYFTGFPSIIVRRESGANPYIGSRFHLCYRAWATGFGNKGKCFGHSSESCLPLRFALMPEGDGAHLRGQYVWCVHRAHQFHATRVRLERRPRFQAEHNQGDHRQSHLRSRLAAGAHLSGRHVHESVVPDHVQARGVLSGGSCAACLH